MPDDDETPGAFFADEHGIHTFKSPIEAHREMLAKHQMMLAELQTSIRAMLMNLSADDAWTMFRVLQGITNASNPAEMASFYSGTIAMMMDLKFDRCHCCGKERHGFADVTPEQFGAPSGQAD